MRKLLTSRLFRCTLCLILVCCMIVNCLAIKADATLLGGTALALFGDDAIALIAACIIGLGVMADTASQTSMLEFRYLCDQAYDAMAAAGEWVVDGAVTVYNCATDLWDYGVDCGMVQWLHDWLFDSGALSVSENYVFMYADSATVMEFYHLAMAYPYHCVAYNDTNDYWYFIGSNGVLSYRINGDGYFIGSEDEKSYFYKVTSASAVSQSYNRAGLFTGTFINISPAGVSSDFSSSLDVSLGTVAPPGTEIKTEYGEYIVIVAPNGVPDTGGDGSGDDEQPQIPIIPVPIMPSYDDTIQLPQEDIWKGNKVETEDPDTGGSTDPSTGTDTDDPDSGSNDPTTPTTGTDTDSDTQPDTPGTPSSDIGDYQIDLKQFFPFCIPFDLYDFFTCLNADPVAPVIEWVIPLPGGDTYPLVIDLSAFDGVAQLLRRLQLLLFCVGLAFKTRDLIKG